MKRKRISTLILFSVFIVTITFSGCAVTFNANDTLQFNLSKPTEEAVSLIAEFESGQENNVAGDVTQKAGSVCAGGACIIY